MIYLIAKDDDYELEHRVKFRVADHGRWRTIAAFATEEEARSYVLSRITQHFAEQHQDSNVFRIE